MKIKTLTSIQFPTKTVPRGETILVNKAEGTGLIERGGAVEITDDQAEETRSEES